MWKKIDNAKDLNKVGVGTILVKYPVEGDPVEKIDFADAHNLLRYEIYAISEGVADLRIPEQDIPNPSHILGLGHVTGQLDNPPLLYKRIDHFVLDKNWWFQV